MIRKYFILGLSILINITFGYSQVTIGSGEAPEKGAILQLKNIDGITDDSANSTKGLGLPRVALTDLNNLYPMFTSDGSGGYKIGSTSYTKTDEDKKHIGLIVYNITESYLFCPDLYAWNGDHWIRLKESPLKEDIEMVDSDNNVYTAKWYSDPCDYNKGAYWITSNLYTTQKNSGGAFTDGTPTYNAGFTETSGAEYTPANVTSGYLNSNSKVITIYEGTSSTNVVPTNIPIKDYVKRFGLLYKWEQAKEACPKGWRIPTANDVKLLVKALGGSDIAGKSMKSSTPIYLKSKTIADGQSQIVVNPTIMEWYDVTASFIKAPYFETTPSGSVSFSKSGSNQFGESVTIWSENKTINYVVYNVDSISINIPYTTNIPYTGKGYFSVRCIK